MSSRALKLHLSGLSVWAWAYVYPPKQERSQDFQKGRDGRVCCFVTEGEGGRVAFQNFIERLKPPNRLKYLKFR